MAKPPAYTMPNFAANGRRAKGSRIRPATRIPGHDGQGYRSKARASRETAGAMVERG
jgi:hypothetical protein